MIELQYAKFHNLILVLILLIPWGMGWGRVLTKRPAAKRKRWEAWLCFPLLIPPGFILYAVILNKSPTILSFLAAIPIVPFFSLLWMMFVTSPFVVLLAQKIYTAVDPQLKATARNLGMDSTGLFLQLTWPLVRKYWVGGTLAGLCRCASEGLSLDILTRILTMNYGALTAKTFAAHLEELYLEIHVMLILGLISYVLLVFLYGFPRKDDLI